jgi:hypothetical protein
MLLTTIGRWMEEDPEGFDAGDPNLNRYVGNNPANLTDPSGLVPFTVKARADYKDFPLEVHDPSWIVWDVLLSGMGDPAIRKLSTTGESLLGGAFGPRSFYQAMDLFCKNNKEYGKDWKPVPVAFRLTGLQFLPTGGLVGPPRREFVSIPGFADNQRRVAATDKEVPVAHFYIEGYWIFKCVNETKKEESPLYGIETEGKVHTWQHTVYDEQWTKELKAVTDRWTKELKNKDQGLLISKASSDRDELLKEEQLKQLKALGQITSKFLEVKPGDQGKDLKKVKLSDPNIYGEKFQFPK